MSCKLQLLHLSDLHIRMDQGFDRSLVLDPLLERLDNDFKKGFTPELVLVTGDIAFSGLQAEYEEAKKFLTDLLETLKLPEKRLLYGY
ncbi:MAG: hypothetical protein OEM02_06550 [Desulfobulbaceae bacterium]|nr:hypothetical protein [Desulfobulbaceae bacterium]